MRTLLVAMSLPFIVAGCATTEKEPPPKPFTVTRWQVTLEIPLAGEQPFVRFGDGRMEGFGGCNRIGARIVQDSVGSRFIAIGRIESGRRACDASVQAAEVRMLEVLQSVSSYTISGDLMVMNGSAGTLKFKALPETPVPGAPAPAEVKK